MNREIKFRGKNGNDWVFGSLVYSHKENQYYITEHSENELSFEVAPETVGQFTGLRDKNGKEIYEGDILAVCEYDGKTIENYYAKVIWDDCSFITEHADEQQEWLCYHFADSSCSEIEVIGNIHDNPELLTN